MRALILASLFFVACPPEVPACSATTCPTGCCDSAGQCKNGSETSACGLGGAQCSVCLLSEQCMQGHCTQLVSTGGGSTGGGSTGGGSTGGGSTGGGSTGGGSAGGIQSGLEVVPSSAVVPQYSSLELAGRVLNSSDRVTFQLLSGPGVLTAGAPSRAVYFAGSGTASARILAVAASNPGLTRTIDLSISDVVTPFFILPGDGTLYPVAPGTRQSYAPIRSEPIPGTASTRAVAVQSVQWRVWPTGTIDSTGTYTAGTTDELLFARNTAENTWASVDLLTSASAGPSIAITPAYPTTTRNGVVQFTANVSNGASVSWDVLTVGGGTINPTTGQYQAPSTPGLYVIEANNFTSGPRRSAYTVVIVQ